MKPDALRVGIVGPLPPPSGGMANQTQQLAELLRREGVVVEVLQTNAPYRPSWVARWRGVRALFRLLPFLLRVWRLAARVDVIHLMANSGWTWHLVAAPVIWIARLRGAPVIVNYRGGGAEAFLDDALPWVEATLKRADLRVTPSGFLQAVFAARGIEAEVIPNIIDLERFRPSELADRSIPTIVVARNLEPIYDIATAIRAFALVRQRIETVRLAVAGIGPEETRLRALAHDLGVADGVHFSGRVDNAQMPALYGAAAVALNPSRVDNMPISVLEAFACGVPVVSTRVGGVPYIAQHERNALLVEAGDTEAMAQALLQVLTDAGLARRLTEAASQDVRSYGWPAVRGLWLATYHRVSRRLGRVEVAP